MISDEPRDMLVPSMIDHSCRAMFETYRSLLEQQVPRELARMVLPLNTYSHMFAKVNLRNLLHFLDLRCHEHAQYEIHEYANALRDLADHVVPVAMAAWRKEHDRSR